MGMTRREALGGFGALALGPALTRAAFAADQRPNILFIMTDDHAAHALSCYGSRLNKTPNLDRIAREGMLFRNCFVTNSLCGPSRATLLTGKYSHANGITRNGQTFDGSQPTFPKLLQQAGYQTAIIGKWHLRSAPTGFGYWNVLPGQGAYFNPVFIEMGERKRLKGYTTDIITDLAIEWLKKGRDASKPFCLLCHHKAPHRNWQPHPKYAEVFRKKKFPPPPTFDDDWSTRASPAHTQAMTVAKHLTRADLKMPIPEGLGPEEEKLWRYNRYMQDYLACIQSVDDGVGRILDFLEKSGLAKNTVVIYTTDNGFFLGDHGWFDKRFMYEESIRIPFLVRWPGAIKPGSEDEHLVLNVDFAPTFLDLAGLPVPKDMHGRSLRPILEGRPPADWRTSFYYHYYEFPGAHSVRRHYGVRTIRYKLIHYYRIGEWELFDLEKDPNELRNVYSDPAYAPVVEKLKAELDRLRKELAVPEDSDLRGLPAAEKPVTGPQLVLDFDGKRPFADSSPAKRKLKATAVKTAEGRIGKAALLDGKSSVLDLPRDACPAPHSTPVTVMAWVKPSKPDGIILAHGGNLWGYCLHLVGARPAFSTRVNSKLTTAMARDKLPEGWSHIAGRLDKGGRMALFVNGRQVAKAKAPGLLGADPHDNLQIGVDAGSPIVDEKTAAERYGGLLDDLKVVYGPVTDKEIARESK